MADAPDPRGRAYRGAELTVFFDARRCIHAAECARGLPAVFDTSRKPWVAVDEAAADAVATVVERCPSGALTYERAEGPAEAPAVPTRIEREPGGPLRVRGDATELGVVFRNLLENAVKYSADQVLIRIGIEEVGDGRVRIEISDHGVGIPKQELGRIFNRFYRAGRDVKRQVSGLGLGLFVVRALLRKHGGRIVALSEGAGRGSRFVVTLRPA